MGAGSKDTRVVELALRLGDDALILGHRLSEWCARAPTLEEDVALANVALDCLGHASLFLELAAARGGEGRTADELAFLRDAIDFRNVVIVELPNGDFGQTILRQFLFDSYRALYLAELMKSGDPDLAGIAAKARKEVEYHLRHSSSWVIRLGDGTSESHERMRSALNFLWPYTAELFASDPVEDALAADGIAPHRPALADPWHTLVGRVFETAALEAPPRADFFGRGGWQGFHSEHLGHLLAEMQVVVRAHPGAVW